VFQGYENRKFRFLTADNQDLKELASNVKSLALDRPVKADVLPAVGKLMEGVLVQGYEKLALQFMKGGETQTLAMAQVRRVTLGFDFQRVQASTAVQVISRGEEVDVAQYLMQGQVTVLHIHSESLHASVRQGNYLERLVEKDPEGLAMIRITVPDWNAPVCRQLGVKSLPQFWFHDASGRLAVKLTERFTEEDLDRALDKARRAAR
jgi:hypothetical protein